MHSIPLADVISMALLTEQREAIQLGFWPADLCMTPGWTYADFLAATMPSPLGFDHGQA